ncbi:hypothetical protein DFH07DRAFT_766695 [Mycena maculata]|uniref:Uncharacterized protein n=1 Tax=Mycena maculata TaxID=230809 RepID=A0AAD7K1T9_9AGAR|nr:hypothetical protein DFH07DRAFT_766695 [Mycena maculata]
MQGLQKVDAVDAQYISTPHSGEVAADCIIIGMQCPPRWHRINPVHTLLTLVGLADPVARNISTIPLGAHSPHTLRHVPQLYPPPIAVAPRSPPAALRTPPRTCAPLVPGVPHAACPTSIRTLPCIRTERGARGGKRPPSQQHMQRRARIRGSTHPRSHMPVLRARSLVREKMGVKSKNVRRKEMQVGGGKGSESKGKGRAGDEKRDAGCADGDSEREGRGRAEEKQRKEKGPSPRACHSFPGAHLVFVCAIKPHKTQVCAYTTRIPGKETASAQASGEGGELISRRREDGGREADERRIALGLGMSAAVHPAGEAVEALINAEYAEEFGGKEIEIRSNGTGGDQLPVSQDLNGRGG